MSSHNDEMHKNHLKFLKDFRWSSMSRAYKYERWINPAKGVVLFDLIRNGKCKSYFESGTANGFSTLYAALALPEDGVIHTFDPANRKKLWDDAHFDGMHYLDKIHYHNARFNTQGVEDDGEDSGTEPWKSVADYLPGEGPRFFFIDGDHSFTGVKKDFHSIKHFLEPGDMVCFDDVAGEKRTLKGYLDSLANMPHTITKFEVERIWIDETVRIPKGREDEIRKQKSALGLIRVIKCSDIKARKKDHFRSEHAG